VVQVATYLKNTNAISIRVNTANALIRINDALLRASFGQTRLTRKDASKGFNGGFTTGGSWNVFNVLTIISAALSRDAATTRVQILQFPVVSFDGELIGFN